MIGSFSTPCNYNAGKASIELNCVDSYAKTELTSSHFSIASILDYTSKGKLNIKLKVNDYM